MLALIFSAAGGKILAVLAAIFAMMGAYFGIRHSGVQAQKSADTRKNLQQVESRDEVADKISSMSDSDVDRQLRSKWER